MHLLIRWVIILFLKRLCWLNLFKLFLDLLCWFKNYFWFFTNWILSWSQLRLFFIHTQDRKQQNAEWNKHNDTDDRNNCHYWLPIFRSRLNINSIFLYSIPLTSLLMFLLMFLLNLIGRVIICIASIVRFV